MELNYQIKKPIPKNRDGFRTAASTGGGTRTHTRDEPQWILNPSRLPIPPRRQQLGNCLKYRPIGQIGSPDFLRSLQIRRSLY